MDDMQLTAMPGKGTIDAVFILRIQKYIAKEKKLHMCFVDLEEALDRVPRKVVEWATRKKGIEAVISLCKGAEIKVKVETHLSEEFEANAGVHHGSVLSQLLLAIVIDVVTNKIKEGMLQEMLYADDVVLIAETMVEVH